MLHCVWSSEVAVCDMVTSSLPQCKVVLWESLISDTHVHPGVTQCG